MILEAFVAAFVTGVMVAIFAMVAIVAVVAAIATATPPRTWPWSKKKSLHYDHTLEACLFTRYAACGNHEGR